MGEVGLILALGLVTSCCGHRLHDGDLHTVGWGEGPSALVTPVKVTSTVLQKTNTKMVQK